MRRRQREEIRSIPIAPFVPPPSWLAGSLGLD
jgi:hypothetical protein